MIIFNSTCLRFEPINLECIKKLIKTFHRKVLTSNQRSVQLFFSNPITFLEFLYLIEFTRLFLSNFIEVRTTRINRNIFNRNYKSTKLKLRNPTTILHSLYLGVSNLLYFANTCSLKICIMSKQR